MTSTPRAEMRHRSYWVIGSVLLGLVFLLISAAFLLDRQFRPRIGTTPISLTAEAPPGPQATAQPTGGAPVAIPWQPIATSALEREIEEAYARYWLVLSDAYLHLDPARLPSVAEGDELRRAQSQIRELQSRGRAGKVAMEHHPVFWEVSPDRAVIYDEHVNRSVFVDLATKQDIPTTAPPELAKVSYELRRIGGAWRVVDGAIHD